MATPQRNIPEPNPKPEPPLRDDRQVAKDVGARVTFGWGWIILAIVIILIVWFGGFGWGTYGGWWWGRHPTVVEPANGGNGQTPAASAGLPANNGTPTPQGSNAALGGDGVQILTSQNKQALVGRPFDIGNVPIEEKDGPRAFWIGANNITPMLVVLSGPAVNASANIASGTRVSITGIVERAPSAAQAKRLWSISDDGARRLEQEGAYVQATQVQP